LKLHIANPRFFFFYAIALIIGIYLAESCSRAALWIIVIGAACIFGIGMYRYSNMRTALPGIFCVLILGILLYNISLSNAPVFEKVWEQGVTITGRVCQLPYESDDALKLTLDQVVVHDGLSEIPLNKNLELTVEGEGIVTYQYGDCLRLDSDLYQYRTPSNPYEPNRYLIALARGTGYYSYAQGADIQTEGNRSDFYGIFVNIRKQILEFIHKAAGEEGDSILAAMTVGEQREIDTDVQNAFSDVGVSHVLSVSGLHIGFLLLVLKKLLQPIPLGKKSKFFILLSFIIAYCMVTAFSVPVLRAGLMFAVFLFAELKGKRYDLLNALGMTAILLLLFNPLQVFTVSFQLSFCACLGIALFENTLHCKKRYLNKSAALLSTTIGASLMTLPLVIYYFNKLSLISLLANFLLVPAASLIIGVSFFSSLIAFLNAGAGLFGLGIAGWLATLYVHSVEWLAGLPWAKLAVATPPVWTVLVYMVLIFFVSRFILVKGRWKTVLSLLTAAVYTAVMMCSLLLPTQNLKITVLSVNNALCIHLQTPDGRNYLIDTAESTAYSGGEESSAERILIPYLRRKGIAKLDGVFISHENSDHCGGLYVLQEYAEIENIYYPDLTGYTDDFQQLLAVYREQGTACYALSQNNRLETGELQWKVLNPVALAGNADENDFSMVLQLTFGDTQIIFPADISQKVEQQMIGQYDLACDILIAAHHGSSTATSEIWLQALKPDYVVISEGGRFPDSVEKTVERLEQYNLQAYDTDISGAVMFFVTEQGSITARTMR